METSQIAHRYNLVEWALDERLRRLFSAIAMNWRGEPLISHEVMLNLIANTKTGLSVRAELDNSAYPKGIKVSDADFASINMVRDTFHGDWNYSIYPRR